MPKKIKDLAVKVGEYQNAQGETKGRWQNVGAVMQADDGGKFLLLHRHFNPAGVISGEGRDSILVSMFDPQQQQQAAPAKPASDAAQPAGAAPDDDIPF